MKKALIDTTRCNANDNDMQLRSFKQAIDMGWTLVVNDTAVNMRVLLFNQDWFEEELKLGRVRIQKFYSSIDKMVEKPFHWGTFGIDTPACDSMEECLKNHFHIEEAKRVQGMCDLIERYGIGKENWKQDFTPEPLADEYCDILGLSPKATRSQVLGNCKKMDRMDIFEEFDKGYVRGMARQHGCESYMEKNGELVSVK